MTKRCFVLFLCVVVCLLWSNLSYAEDESLPQLVKNIGAANNQELTSLNFFELNILKNSIYSAKGYQYANDRQWLYSYFYQNAVKHESNFSLFKNKWDLSKYNFPKPKKDEQFRIDKDMEKAIANIRVAIYKKVRAYPNLNTVDQEINKEIAFYQKKENQFIFGRKIDYVKEFGDSLRREAHGYKLLMTIIDSDQSFDACELLGVYVGSVVLLRNIIEAKNGKIFTGITAWEISQIVGVTPKEANYNPDKLPQTIKQKIEMLDSIIYKMTSSGIGDVPQELQDATISIEYYEGC